MLLSRDKRPRILTQRISKNGYLKIPKNMLTSEMLKTRKTKKSKRARKLSLKLKINKSNTLK